MYIRIYKIYKFADVYTANIREDAKEGTSVSLMFQLLRNLGHLGIISWLGACTVLN